MKLFSISKPILLEQALIVLAVSFLISLAACQSEPPKQSVASPGPDNTPDSAAEPEAESVAKTQDENLEQGEEQSGVTFVLKEGDETVATASEGTHVGDLPPQMLDFLVRAEKQAIEKGTLIGEPRFHDETGRRLSRSELKNQ